jgi:hypothetical protein
MKKANPGKNRKSRSDIRLIMFISVLASLSILNNIQCYSQNITSVSYLQNRIKSIEPDLNFIILSKMKQNNFLANNRNLCICNIFNVFIINKFSKAEFINGDFLKSISVIPPKSLNVSHKRKKQVSAETILSYGDSSIYYFTDNQLVRYSNCYAQELYQKLINYYFENHIDYSFRIYGVDFSVIIAISKNDIFVLQYKSETIQKYTLEEFSKMHWEMITGAFK